MATAQAFTISGASGITASNTSTSYTIAEGGLAFPDFDMRLTYAPDSDDVAGAVLIGYALGVGTLPLTLDVRGSSLADMQTKRRALEAAFSQAGETITLTIGTQTETYPMFPTWPKWGAVNSGALEQFIATATLAVPVNPMTTDSSSSSSS